MLVSLFNLSVLLMFKNKYLLIVCVVTTVQNILLRYFTIILTYVKTFYDMYNLPTIFKVLKKKYNLLLIVLNKMLEKHR